MRFNKLSSKHPEDQQWCLVITPYTESGYSILQWSYFYGDWILGPKDIPQLWYPLPDLID